MTEKNDCRQVTEALKQKLRSLADRYEVFSFCDEDPSQFLRWYTKPAEAESASFLAAMLAFGNRKQFIPKIRGILEMADKSCGSYLTWLQTGRYKQDFPHGENKFYRFYSYDDMQVFFDECSLVLKKGNSFGEFFWKEFSNVSDGEPSTVRPRAADALAQPQVTAPAAPHLAEIISSSFPNSKIVPKGKTSANKRIHMFLRWMVRQNSPVDLGLWSWYPASALLIPLDVHVMQEAISLGLLPASATPSRRIAATLTAELAQVFPGDPARGDFSLFGLGIDGK